MREGKKAIFYTLLEDNNNVECNLCPHCCKIASGKSGICGVRINHSGVLAAESYGRVTSMALDPIEKKPLYHFYPGAKILSLGSYGCNFRCDFCQNHGISMRGSSAPYREYTPDEIAAASQELAIDGNIGVAYTYNEPLIGYEFVEDCAKLVRRQEQKNVLVTNGFISPAPLERLLPWIDAVNIDLKSFNPEFYREIGGTLEDVRRNIKIAASHCHIEVTTLAITGKNDSEDEIDALSEWLSGIDKSIPLHISRFFPAYKLRNISPTPIETIYRLADVARCHLKYVYTGNC